MPRKQPPSSTASPAQAAPAAACLLALVSTAPALAAQGPSAEPAPRSAAAPVDRSAHHARPAGAASPAHSIPPSNPDRTLRLIPIEAGIEDVSPLAVGLRTVPIDLRAPLDYDRVYRVEGDLSRFGLMSASTPDAAWYARASGGTLALFPRSEYVPTRRGAMPVVPANTTFLMGVPSVVTTLAAPGGANAPQWNATPATRRADGPQRPTQAPPSARDGAPTSAAASAATATPTAPRPPNPTANAASDPASNPAPDTIWTSESLRTTRLSALLARVRASRAAETAPPPAPPASPPPASAPPASAPPASAPPVTPASAP
jgi:hypothetical protein